VRRDAASRRIESLRDVFAHPAASVIRTAECTGENAMKFTTIGTAVGAALLISRSARANAGAGAPFSDLSPALTTGSDLAATI